MKNKLKQLIQEAAAKAHQNGDLPSPDIPEVEIGEPKAASHGDFSTNIAMQMASIQKMPPRKISEAILAALAAIDDNDHILEKTEIAGPGFINFFLTPSSWYPYVKMVHDQGAAYGSSDIGQGKRVQVEFVSANPTGPLHVGHGRGAAVGDSVARILSFCGYSVQREYYVNDSGRQIRTLGLSVFLRYNELLEVAVDFPEDCYQGAYIIDFAKDVMGQKGRSLLEEDREEAISFCAGFAARKITESIKNDLDVFGVEFDKWFSEQSLFDEGLVEASLTELKNRGVIYKKDGADWFNTSEFGDEKDRVVVRENGLTTYFASDIAYHKDKFDRGFQQVIDVWGADHHGYIPRIKACVEASGNNPDDFHVILVQLVNLLRGGEPVAMSTRSGEFVTLKDVLEEVGTDAARFIFLTRHYESPLDFDLELAKQKTNDNPVYYVQYVHARISSIARKAQDEKGLADIIWDDHAVSRLTEPEELKLIQEMVRYPEVVALSANFLEPHRITFYLMNLASLFHSYYNKHRVLEDDKELTMGRLYLIMAVKKIIKNGLELLGVSAPEKM